MWKILSIAALALLPIQDQKSGKTLKQAPELGRVHWARKLEPALQASAIDHKPVLLLFQEVPG